MEEESELTDFEAGFLMGYFAAKGFPDEPTVEQFSEAAEALAATKRRMDS